MNKKSFDKIINQDYENINENDIKRSLEYFFAINDEEEKKKFLSNFKGAVKYYFDNYIKKDIDTYPVRESENLNVYRADRLSFYIYSLYGMKDLDIFKVNKSKSYNGVTVFNFSFARYRSIVREFLTNEEALLYKLNTYRIETELRKKITSLKVDKDLLKEAYYTYLAIDNYSDKGAYFKRVDSFMKKYNVSKDTLKDYVTTYGLLYLNLDYNQVQRRLRVINTLNRDNSTPTDKKLVCILNKINVITNETELEELVGSNHISLDLIDYLYEKGYLDKEFYKEISSKVEHILNNMCNNHKYIHYSVSLSMLEKETDEDTIDEIIKNNLASFREIEVGNFISIYRLNYTYEKKEKLKEDLQLKINKSKERIKEKESKIREQKKIKNIKPIVDNIDFTLFLDDNIKSLNQFCELVSISKSKFYKYLKVLEITNNSLYLKIKEKLQNRKIHSRIKINIDENGENVAQVVKKIENGIEDNEGNIRKFELLDYYLSTKLSLDEFISTYINSDKCNKTSLATLKKFLSDNIVINNRMPKMDVDKELNGTTIFMIDGSPYEVSKEEKEKTLDFLRGKDIPLYTKVYKQALKRYINGTLLEEVKEYKKTL